MRRKKNNAVIYQIAKNENVYLWEVAECLNIRDAELSRRLRRELPEKERDEILSIIKSISEARDDERCEL